MAQNKYTNYNQTLSEINSDLNTILLNAEDQIDDQADLIQQMLQLIQTKSGGKNGCKYFWIKYDIETDDNINIIEFKIDDDVAAFPEDGLNEEDGFYYKRISHVLIQDNEGKTAILDITPIEEVNE